MNQMALFRGKCFSFLHIGLDQGWWAKCFPAELPCRLTNENLKHFPKNKLGKNNREFGKKSKGTGYEMKKGGKKIQNVVSRNESAKVNL